jgi:hypothetical protein
MHQADTKTPTADTMDKQTVSWIDLPHRTKLTISRPALIARRIVMVTNLALNSALRASNLAWRSIISWTRVLSCCSTPRRSPRSRSRVTYLHYDIYIMHSIVLLHAMCSYRITTSNKTMILHFFKCFFYLIWCSFTSHFDTTMDKIYKIIIFHQFS